MSVDVVYSQTEPRTPGYRVLGSYALIDEGEQALMTAWVRERERARAKREPTKTRHDGRLRKRRG